MENENEIIIDSQENNEEEIILEELEDEQEEEKPIEKPQESLEDKRARLKRQLGQVEKKLGVVERPKEVQRDSNLSSRDLYSLMEAKVSQDDVDEVVDYAKLKGITIQEALKAPMVKTLLQVKSEERNTAQATYSGSTKRTTQKISDDTLLSNASAGKLPESEEDLIRLIKARKGFRN